MIDKKQSDEKLEGILDHIVYCNEESGYSVVRLITADSHLEVVATGFLAGVDIGEKLTLNGSWILHPEYGMQFQFSSYQIKQPETKEGIRKFLSSSLIKGIGPKTAERIVNAFGEKALEIIDKEPASLESVAGIGKAKRKIIEQGWQEKKGIKNIMLFLQRYNLKTPQALKIYKTYGDKSFQVLRSDPYRLTEDIYGIGFKTADAIARNFGIAKDSEPRIEAALKYLIKTFAEEGHCFARRNELLLRSEELLAVKRNEIDNVLQHLLEKKALIAQRDAIYHPFFYHSEKKAAQKLLELIKDTSARLVLFKDVDWQKVFDWLHDKQHIRYPEMQKKAVITCLTNKVTVLTGGPGTGKSTITKALTTILEAKKIDFFLTAPTGRAAKRLSEVTGHQAQTIHRLLEFSWQKGLQFRRNENNPLEAAMIIIDEASMLDIIMFYHLLKAVKFNTHLVLIGDIDQLPSVGPGFVLNDIIDSNRIPVVRLNQIFRQQSGSKIITNAHRIRQGLRPLFCKNGGDFFFFGTDSPEKTSSTIIQLVTQKIPHTFGYDPMQHIQVLAPMHRGEIGIKELNRKLQSILNPYSDDASEIVTGEKTYRVHDRIIQLKNNYEKDVFNGDLGTIAAIDKEQQIIRISFENKNVDYEIYELDQITHSYAISVHKSQGSEFPVVVVPLLMQHYIMLQRNLLYTAITRARSLVVITGSLQAIDTAIRNNKIIQRNTMLTEILSSEGEE